MTTTNRFNRRHFLASALGSILSLSALPAGAAHTRRTVLIQQSPLAGFQYHDGEVLWQHLSQGDVLTLARETDNKYDARAVRVDWRGHKLGYIPRRENTAVAQMLDRGQRLEARIASLGDGPSPWHRIELDLRLIA